MRRNEALLSNGNKRRLARAQLVRAAALAFALAAFSCGSKGAVSVTALIQNPVMVVGAPSALAAQLNGSFSLHLDLGQVAPSGTDITIEQGNFSLVNPANQSTLLLLKFTTAPVAPYHHLEPGGQLDIAFTVADNVGTPGQLLTRDAAAGICAARAAVQIAGSFSDSVNGSTAVNSAIFTVDCQ
jgi:hypothetical protein